MFHVHVTPQCDQIELHFVTFEKFKKVFGAFEGLISMWQNFEPSLAKSNTFWHTFILVNGQILKN